MIRDLAAAGPLRAAPATSPVLPPDRLLQLAEAQYALRRRRERFVATDLLGEPAWDILLDLFIAARRGRVVSTSSACVGANVPATTALRWLQVLQDRGLLERYADKRDSRRTLVRISATGNRMLEDYFSSSYAVAVPDGGEGRESRRPRPFARAAR